MNSLSSYHLPELAPHDPDVGVERVHDLGPGDLIAVAEGTTVLDVAVQGHVVALEEELPVAAAAAAAAAGGDGHLGLLLLRGWRQLDLGCWKGKLGTLKLENGVSLL